MPAPGAAPVCSPEECHVAVIGLGYVGLPLAVELATRYPTLGYDTDPVRVSELARGDERLDEGAQLRGAPLPTVDQQHGRPLARAPGGEVAAGGAQGEGTGAGQPAVLARRRGVATGRAE